MNEDLKIFLREIKDKNKNEPEFYQAVEEVLVSLWGFVEENPKYKKNQIIERLVEPDRVLQFKIEWLGDDGKLNLNRGYRVQFSNILGPYKGGLRFHPTVNPSILKFLGFEQIFKNSLTGLPLGGGKGGSDFDPKGKSEKEVERFSRAFMRQLIKYIGHDVDVPAGDIGVGGREIHYMFDEYKKLGGTHPGVLTGKHVDHGGSQIRTEATGFGLVYFVEEMLKIKDDSLKDKICLVSGSGNVAQHAIEKLIEKGAKPVSVSDSGGTVYDEEGIDREKLNFILDLKNIKRGRIKEYIDKYPKAKYVEGEKPWGFKCDIALPCATQNEIDLNDAKKLIENGCFLVAEGANMPTTKEGVELFLEKNINFGPAKACNAGGVAVSGLEMEQNANGKYWSRKEVDEKLQEIMKHVHEECVKYGQDDYVKGANIAGFVRVVDSILDN